MPKIVICHVLNELRSSGAEVMLHQANPYWREAGFESVILTCENQVGHYAAVLESVGFKIEHLPIRKSLIGIFRLHSRLARINPNILHIHSEKMSFFVSLVAKLSGIRTIIRTVHSTFPFDGLLKYRKKFERTLQRYLGVRHLAIGPSVANNEHNRFQNHCLVYPNWFDASHFIPPTNEEIETARAELGLTPGELVLVSVGNCNVIKNHTSLLLALAQSPLRERNWFYLHAGQEEPQASERALAQSLGIRHKVRFLGPVQDVRRILWASDLFVMPSLYEGFGNAAIEAAGTGIPMLLPRTSGLLDLGQFDQPSSIHWAENPSPHCLAKALEQMLNQLPARVRRPWVNHFSIPEGASRYTELYRSISLPQRGLDTI